MPAVCSICYHTYKRKYGLDEVKNKIVIGKINSFNFIRVLEDIKRCVKV